MRYRSRWIGLFAAGLLCAVPGAARAQSAEAIQKYLVKQAPGCSLYGYREYMRGKVPGTEQPVVIAAYTLESCGGGNNYVRTVDVFYGTNADIRYLKRPATPIMGPDVDDRDGITVSGDVITIRSSAYGPDDPRCCPSLKQTARYRLVNGAIVPAG